MDLAGITSTDFDIFTFYLFENVVNIGECNFLATNGLFAKLLNYIPANNSDLSLVNNNKSITCSPLLQDAVLSYH